MNDYIYLDHAATSPMHPAVIEEMTAAMKRYYGNASSIHQVGRKSKGLLEEARVVFAGSIHAKPDEIVITSGGTESDNMAIIKTAEKFKDRGKHIITTEIEHPAVLKPMEYLEKSGYDVTYLPVNKEGRITVHQVEEALREDTILVSVIYGNNEIGSLMPVREIGELLHNQERKIVFHTDAVQALGTEAIHVKEGYIDLLSVSAHKINGPKGVGFLYVDENLAIPSLLLGGGQENKRRAGTENIPAILGFKKAVELRMQDKEELRKKYMDYKLLSLRELDALNVEYSVNGSIKDSLPHILSLHIKDIPADKLLIHLDLAKIAVSIGSACSAGNVDPSHVLLSLYGKDHPAIEETIRLSFGYGLTEKAILESMKQLKKAVDFLRQN